MDREQFRILLIEDDEDDFFIVKTFLSKARFAVCNLDWASNYERGLASLFSTDCDVCLLDYLLGARSGLELLREAIGGGCEIPIILLTGKGSENLDLEAMWAGASDYLVKGEISRELLERSIRYCIFRKRTETNLRRKTAELARANEALRLDDLRLQALLELSQKNTATVGEIVDFVVEQQVKLTGSQVGRVYR